MTKRMRQKITNKHGKKKSQPNGELPLGIRQTAAAFSLGAQARAQQLFSITGKTDAELRRIQIQRDAGGNFWFPKPVNGKWNTPLTLAGLLRFEQSRAEKSNRLPVFANMEQCEGGMHVPKSVQQFAKRKGCAAFMRNGNVSGDELAKWLKSNVLEKLFSGDTSQLASLGIEGFENIDGDYQQKRLAKARADEQERLNAEADGILHKQFDVWSIVFENGVQPIRDELARMEALDSQCNPDHPEIARAALKDWRDRLLKKCAAACPPRKIETTAVNRHQPSLSHS